MRAKTVFLAAWLLVLSTTLSAQAPATVREYVREYVTYPYSDPDPIPNQGKIYPYFRFDGYTDKPETKAWKVVELENDYIHVSVMPEIGGKIWTAVDKRSGRPFLYDNNVVKFRDIAMRGPWTSGGVEANYGLIGHTPNCATPVDYITAENADKSTSCWISVLDRLTDTRWTLEIRLPHDKAFFITRSFWHNGSSEVKPYYTWMNAAVKAAADLEFIYPGKAWIGHSGDGHPWPEEGGVDLSEYTNNAFDGAKSYHVMNRYDRYFGAYYRNSDEGMIHYAERDEKPGRKLFLWALSDNGAIWEELLTDDDGQYVEMQSGRLFNQNMEASIRTPFKQTEFTPGQTDTWSEYWYPFSGTGGAVDANLYGVFNCVPGEGLEIRISPVSFASGVLELCNEECVVLASREVSLTPLEPQTVSFAESEARGATFMRFGNERIDISPDSKKELDRPVENSVEVDWNSAYGLWLEGKNHFRMGNYGTAERLMASALAKDGTFLPAMVEMAVIKYRRMDYATSYEWARKAIGVDTYDAAANYYYGLSAKRLSRNYDALDGFETASRNPLYAAAAHTRLAEMYLSESNLERAMQHALKSLNTNPRNISGLKVLSVAERLSGKDAAGTLVRIRELDPMDHFVRFEEYLADGSESAKNAFTSLITGEMPTEQYLAIADWYLSVGRERECISVLELAPQNAEIAYWLAWLDRDSAEAARTLSEADKNDAKFVFPYKSSSAGIMKWAAENTDDWKPLYFLSLIERSRGNGDEALRLLSQVDGRTGFAPFHILRGSLSGDPEKDYREAVECDPNEWHYGVRLTDFYISRNRPAEALETISRYHRALPDNCIVGMSYINCLTLNDKYTEAEKELSRLKFCLSRMPSTATIYIAAPN